MSADQPQRPAWVPGKIGIPDDLKALLERIEAERDLDFRAVLWEIAWDHPQIVEDAIRRIEAARVFNGLPPVAVEADLLPLLLFDRPLEDLVSVCICGTGLNEVDAADLARNIARKYGRLPTHYGPDDF